MKKSLIAAAALTAFAGAAAAQSSVTVYGQLDMSYGVNETSGYPNDAAATSTLTAAQATQATRAKNIKSTGLADHALTTSLFGIKGTEDLGNGTRAGFQVEVNLNGVGGQTFSKSNNAVSTSMASGSTTATNSGAFAQYTRQALVSLGSNSLGDLSLGYKKMAELDALESLQQGTGNSFGGKAWKEGGNLDRANGFFYKSPVVNGFQGTVQYSAGKAEYENAVQDALGKVDVNLVGLTLNYNQGPVSAVLHRTQGKIEVGTGQTVENISGQAWTGSAVTNALVVGDNDYNSTVAGAGYDFGIAKANAVYTKRKVGTDAAHSDVKAWDFGLSFPMGKTTLVAAYETATRDNQAGVEQNKISGYQLIAKYDFSKRTTAYALFGKDTLDYKSTTAEDVTYKTTRVGLLHRF